MIFVVGIVVVVELRKDSGCVVGGWGVYGGLLIGNFRSFVVDDNMIVIVVEVVRREYVLDIFCW